LGRKIFITATDTGAGKTYITSRLTRLLNDQGISATALKPVASGIGANGLNEDVAKLLTASHLSEAERLNLYTFSLAASPNIAAAAEGKAIDPGKLVFWCNEQAESSDLCLIEGIGGLMVPLHGRYLVSDWITEMQECELMLIVGARLGCINHALLTLAQLERMGITPRYIVINAVAGDGMAADAERSLRPFIPAGSSLISLPHQADENGFKPLIEALLANSSAG